MFRSWAASVKLAELMKTWAFVDDDHFGMHGGTLSWRGRFRRQEQTM